MSVWTFLSQQLPVARKQHVCAMCALPIEAGVRYVARRGIMEGKPVTVKMHTDCEAVTARWTEDDWDASGDVTLFRQELAEFKARLAKGGGK
jgi:hypothetical protein